MSAAAEQFIQPDSQSAVFLSFRLIARRLIQALCFWQIKIAATVNLLRD
jgi:hypothetical protein